MVQQGKPRLNSLQWRAVAEKKARRGRMWNMIGNAQFRRGMWEYFTLRWAEAKKIREDAARERQRRNTTSVAAGVSFHGDSGAGQRK